VTLELNQMVGAVQELGRGIAGQWDDFERRGQQARAWLAEFAASGPGLVTAARAAKAAIPGSEPLDAVFAAPSLPAPFTVIGADGSQIPPDRHGAALYYLINIGSLVYRHGSGQAPEARSVPSLYYGDEDLYEGAMLVAGNLLDVRRDRAEIAHLAQLVEAEAEGPTLALVDGTLLLWVLENLPAEVKERTIREYVGELERIQAREAALAAFTSRPRSGDVGRLLQLAALGGDVTRFREEPNLLERVPDRAIFAFLPAGARSALFVSPSSINHEGYPPQQRIHFFYINVAEEGEEPVVARIEVPAWVAGAPHLLTRVHGGAVAQCRIAGGFPYVLARADELAFVSGPERLRLEEMIGTALLAAGIQAELSPKASYKRLTRVGRRW